MQLDARSAGEPRFRLLETVREYAAEHLTASGEAAAMGQRYGAYFAGLAEDAEGAIHGPDQVTWLRRLDAETGNLRGALSWARSSGDVELQLRLAGALWEYWWVRGTLSEALWWLERALATGGASGPARARALHGAGMAALLQGALEQAERYFVESMGLWRALGDPAGLALALCYQSTLPWMRGDDAGARALLREALPLWEGLPHAWGIAYTLHVSGMVAWISGDAAAAAALFEDALGRFRALTDGRGTAFASVAYSFLRLSAGEVAQAKRLAKESLALFREWRDPIGYLHALLSLAGSALALGEVDRAARLVGMVDTVRETSGMSFIRGTRQVRDGAEAAARSALGETAFATAYGAGRAIPLEQALEYALEDAPVAA